MARYIPVDSKEIQAAAIVAAATVLSAGGVRPKSNVLAETAREILDELAKDNGEAPQPVVRELRRR